MNVKTIKTPHEADYSMHVYHIYAIKTEDRSKLIDSLLEVNIGCGMHYPIPIHLQEAYKSLNLGIGSFPIAEKVSNEQVSLPIFAEMTDEHVGYVVEMIEKTCQW